MDRQMSWFKYTPSILLQMERKGGGGVTKYPPTNYCLPAWNDNRKEKLLWWTQSKTLITLLRTSNQTRDTTRQTAVDCCTNQISFVNHRPQILLLLLLSSPMLIVTLPNVQLTGKCRPMPTHRPSQENSRTIAHKNWQPATATITTIAPQLPSQKARARSIIINNNKNHPTPPPRKNT